MWGPAPWRWWLFFVAALGVGIPSNDGSQVGARIPNPLQELPEPSITLFTPNTVARRHRSAARKPVRWWPAGVAAQRWLGINPINRHIRIRVFSNTAKILRRVVFENIQLYLYVYCTVTVFTERFYNYS